MQVLTVEEHKQLSAHIRAIERELSAMRRLCEGRMWHRDFEPTINTACKGMARLKSRFEDTMFREHPELGNEYLSLYYGGMD